MQQLILCLALAFVPALATAQQGDPITEFSAEDAVMNAAQDEARESLPLFLANVLDPEGFGAQGTSLKVAFDVGENGTEIIWVGPFLQLDEQAFIGILGNQPNFMDGLNAGDQVEFTREMIRDWSVVGPDGLIYGNYTTRVIIPTLDADTQAQLKARMSANPIPDGW